MLGDRLVKQVDTEIYGCYVWYMWSFVVSIDRTRFADCMHIECGYMHLISALV